MRILAVFIAVILQAVPGLAQSFVHSSFPTRERPIHLFEEENFKQAVFPAYLVAEGVSDRLYNMFSGRMFTFLLPETISEELYAPPEKDSYDLFVGHFQRKQNRFLRRIHDSHPRFRPQGEEGVELVRVREWERYAKREQVSVFFDTFRNTLMDRYQLHIFKSSTEEYARNMDQWSPSFFVMGAALGGGFLFYNGLHAGLDIVNVEFGLDVTAGRRILRASRDGSDLRRAASLDLGYKGLPFKISLESGLHKKKLRHEAIALRFQRKF